MSSNELSVPTLQVASGSNSAVAFEKAKADIMEAAKQETSTMNVDMGTVIRTMLTANGNAEPYREQIKQLAFCDQKLVNNVETYALALGYAQALHSWTLEGPKASDALVEELRGARRMLVAELELVQMRDVLPKEAVKLQGSTSFNAMVEDVRAIATVFLANWDKVGPEIGGNSDRIEAALVASDKLIAALAQAGQIQDKVKGTALMRAAAWTLAHKAHRELERAIAYLRFHEGDADEIVPSLFLRKTRRTGKKEDEEQILNPVQPMTKAVDANDAPGNGSSQPNTPPMPIAPTKSFQ